MFSINTPFMAVVDALFDGRLELAYSNEIMLEWEEMATQFSGVPYWGKITRFFDLITKANGNMIQTEPSFRFGVITADPEDNKFVDCAIVASADFIITEDRHFAPLTNSGYRPQPIKPQAFIDRYLLS